MIDLVIVLTFIVYSICVGFWMRKKASRGLEDYFLAGRTLKGWQAGCSMAATQYAADTPLLVTGLVATAGIFSLWRLWIYAIAFLMMGFVFGACWRRARVLTDAELTELRYGGPGASILRAVKALHMGTMINCTVLAMVLIAATRLSEPFLLWHEWLPQGCIDPIAKLLESWQFSMTTLPANDPQTWIYSANNLISILLILAFTTLYSTTGGLRSVVATDIVQFAIAMIATAFYTWIVLTKIGGVGALPEKIGELYGTPSQHWVLSFGPTQWQEMTFLFTAVLFVQWFAQVSSDGTGYLAQRTMACQTDRDAKIAAVFFTGAQVVLRSLLWIPIALGLLILYPVQGGLPQLGEASEAFRIAREGTFALGIRDFLPPGIRGLMLTGMLAALASTVDTHLNWGASYWTNDLYKRFLMEKFLKRKPSSKELVWIARLSNLLILTIAIIIMANLQSIQGAWHLSLLFGSGLGVVLILRWLWYRINLWSEITAGIVSVFASPFLLIYFSDFHEGYRLLLMVLISTLSVIAVTLMTPPEPREILETFYARVSPPGFWGPFEKKNESIDRFKRLLPATLLASASTFLLVTGLGMLLTGHSFWTSMTLTVLGILLIPFWWRLGMQNNS
ncbi:MAG: Na+:solute symporter [Candidatus Omnitrophica bacterium]|nr:Na+:solute symporter [Candidatus Omnitrophota bacterium]